MLEQLEIAKQTVDAAFQGTHGAFSEDATLKLLPSDSTLLPCPRLEDVFEAVDNGTARFGVVPVENTLSGSIHLCYDLLYEHDLAIVAETVCRMDHALIGRPGTRVEDVRRVLSHPVALAQCEAFFRKHPHIEPVPVYDTAGAVVTVMCGDDPSAAAIASRRAARLWKGEVISSGIQDHEENYTRYLMISKPMELVRPQSLEYKRTIAFRIANEPGALVRALQPFAAREIDLSKIESRPVKGAPFEYMYYLDLVGRTDAETMYEAIQELRAQAISLRVLGVYPRGSV